MRITVHKAARRLVLEENGETREIPVALGRRPDGAKEREGDGRTPEGIYRVVTRNAKSKFGLSLGLSYPGKADALRGLRSGLISREQFQAIVAAHDSNRRPPWDTPLGGFIMIHGGGIETDWTEGCIALRDDDMASLFDRCALGTEVRVCAD